MNNVVKYYYEINLINLSKYNEKYAFDYNGSRYIFLKFDRNENDIKGLVEICNELKKRNIMTNELIRNKFNNYLTPYNGELYIMIKQNIDQYDVTFNDILYVQNNTVNILLDKYLIRTNCISLWENKIDFYEKKSKELSDKYLLIYKTIDYYLGLGETAIMYLANNNVRIDNIVLSHRRLTDFYNPLNYILDSRARDIADYFKYLFFFEDCTKEEILFLLKYINLSREEYILLIARLLYPTYYFDLIDNVLFHNYDEKIIRNIIRKGSLYNKLLKELFYYINYQLGMNIPIIEWIIKT